MDRTGAKRDKSVLKMSEQEFDAWLLEEEPAPPPPSAYPLSTNEGRRGFLESFIWRGETALFEAVSHIWTSLNKPKNARCILIGVASGTGGSGKWALAKFLRQALREALDDGLEAPWVNGCFSDLDELHQEALRYFDASHHHYEEAIQKYADILNGKPGRNAANGMNLLQGPWPRLPGRQRS